ncbi:tyrosine/serine/threonine protein phosphatase pps1, partial [Podila epigama]
LGHNADVAVVTAATTTLASSLASPLTPSTQHSSYFFSSPSTPIPTATSTSASTSAIPNTPPPESILDAPVDEYPPLTPPSLTDLSRLHPSICVECRARANAPTQITLDRIRDNILSSTAPLDTKEIFHLECHGSLTSGLHSDVFPPSTSSLSNMPASRLGIEIDIQAYQTMRRTTAKNLVCGSQISSLTLQTQITHLINMAFFIHEVTGNSNKTHSNSASASRGLQHQVLIHCIDGYTESAMLALVLVMIHYRLSLAEAYVKLQMDLGRSFFVYSNDATMMLEVESQVWQRLMKESSAFVSNRGKDGNSDLDDTSKSVAGAGANIDTSVASQAVPISPTSAITDSPLNSDSSRSSSVSSSTSSFFSALLNMSSSAPPQQQPTPWQSSSMEGVELERKDDDHPGFELIDESESNDDQRMMSSLLSPPYLTEQHLDQFEWFYHPEFEGAFPSRILPYMYLGNLAHASNPGLLKALDIRYVLSVGEEAPRLQEVNATMTLPSSCKSEQNSATESSKFMVKLVDDMYDNGVDSLWGHLEECVNFVDEARKNKDRILIHCRVGVSRSATIVIAYLMAHYNMSLAEAYLLVRARRLSVIIQPNLLFMYELLQWEQRLRGRFDPLGWPGIAREIHSLNMYYLGS